MKTPQHVAIVGAGIGGLRTAEHLRGNGYEGRLTLLGAERHMPYDRPPLSKQILTGDWEPQRAVLRSEAKLGELGLSLVLGRRAVALRGTAVDLDDGATVEADAVVLATGVVPRSLPGRPAGVAALRTLDDAVALRRAFAAATSLLVVGAGVIGAEVTHAARLRGLEVTVLEGRRVPGERIFGERVGAIAARLFTEAGADLRCAADIAGFGDEHTVVLADGTSVTGDVVLACVGATPEVTWLDGSGLDTADGIACDTEGRAAGAERIWAVGDAAAWYDPERGRHCRAEHWTGANDQALAAARSILGLPSPPPAVPYMWSDQFGLKIQAVGRTDLADDVEVFAPAGGGPVAGTVAAYYAKDRLVGAVGFGVPRPIVRCRALIAAKADRAEARRVIDA